MSVDIYPPIAPAELKAALEDAQRRELDWLLDELQTTLVDFRHGLEDCYALLAPIDPGSTLVVSTPRNEVVKGHITRVGTRIVKGTLSLRLRTIPAQTLTIDPTHPIHLAPLTHLHSLLTHALDILTQTLSFLPSPPEPKSPNPGAAAFVAAQLRLLSTTLHDASAILKGPTLTAPDRGWTTLSASSTHFIPPPSHPPPSNALQTLQSTLTASSDDHTNPSNPLQNVSLYFSLQDSSLVLWVRALEPADAVPSFGMKFALAIGTARRLEHDESEQVFGYACATVDGTPGGASPVPPRSSSSNKPVLSGTRDARQKGLAQVYVREKIRVESADPSLMSLAAKLGALSHTLTLARRNLSAVLGEEVEE